MAEHITSPVPDADDDNKQVCTMLQEGKDRGDVGTRSVANPDMKMIMDAYVIDPPVAYLFVRQQTW